MTRETVMSVMTGIISFVYISGHDALVNSSTVTEVRSLIEIVLKCQNEKLQDFTD